MSKQDENTDKEIEVQNYLVTEGVDPTIIDQEKKNADLSLLSQAEEKQNKRSNYNCTSGSSKVLKAASSLKLSNPFKGV